MAEPSESAEQRLRLTEELNDRIVEVVPGGIVHVLADGRVVTANAEALRILGLSWDSLTERYVESFETQTLRQDGSPCPPSDYPVVQALTTGQRTGPTVIGVQRPDGEISWAVFTAAPVRDPDSGTISGAIVTFLDITEQRQAAQRLVRSEARLRSLFESVPSIVLAVDLDGCILDANRVAEGFAVQDVVGASIYEWVHPDERPMVRSAFETVVRTGEVQAYELPPRPGYNERAYDVRLAALRVEGEVKGVTMVANDVSERRYLQAQLITADRMASVGTLAAGVAHEINNPLAYILGNLEELVTSLTARGLDAEDARRMQRIEEGAERILRVVRDLAGYSHSAEETVELDPREVLESTLRLAEKEFRYRAHLVRAYQPTPLVAASRSRLGQVFLNLLVNAAQALPEGHPDDHEIRVECFTNDAGEAVILVSDTGPGIDPSVEARVFEPFVTTKRQGEGTGLGLFISHSIVSSLGGRLTAERREAGGTSFRVVLPPAEGATVGPAPVDAGDRAPETVARVLVVDDEPNILEVLTIALRPHHVTAVRSGEAAIEALREGSFDVVLCDLVMPGLSGMDVYGWALSQRPAIAQRFVFMTGGAFTAEARSFLDSVRSPRIDKPFRMSAIREIIAEALEQTLAV